MVGGEPLPFEEYFSKVGLSYFAEKPDTIDSYGELAFKYVPQTGKFIVSRAETGRNTLGLIKGDEIVKVAGVELNTENYVDLLEAISDPEQETKVKVVFKRNAQGYEVTGKTIEIPVTQLHFIGKSPNATEAQILLRKSLLYLN